MENRGNELQVKGKDKNMEKKHLLIIPNRRKDKDLVKTKKLIQRLEELEKVVHLPTDCKDYKELRAYCIGEATDLYKIEFAIVLGGDGTIIQAAREYGEYDFPLLGVNMGNLGFLAEIEESEVDSVLQESLDENYFVEKRMMIDAYDNDEYLGTALNDVVITRQSISRMISYEIFVNGYLVNQYRADGLIMSTPTGSTAYNLSAGGPIISPTNNSLVFTPICPHSLAARSIVLSGDDKVKISFDLERNQKVDDLLLTLDGQIVHKIDTKTKVRIEKSKKVLKLIRFSHNDFFHILRKKL